MSTYINWSYDSLVEMIAKCTHDMEAIPDKGRKDIVRKIVRDMEDELDMRWNRVSDR